MKLKKIKVGLVVWDCKLHWWVLIEESMAMGRMRPTANGVPFLGCRSWMWVVVCAKWWSEEGYQPLF